MPGNVNRNHRNQRNNPYALDGLAVTIHRSAAGVAWRWRTELAILTATTAGLWKLAHLITYTWAAVTLGLVLLGLGVLPWTRRRFWCVLARHRIHKLCWETRLHTRAGRLPLVLWTRPTRSANGCTCCAGPGSAPKTSKPTSANCAPRASPAKPGSPATAAGPNWSPSTSSAATPSPPPTPSPHPCTPTEASSGQSPHPALPWRTPVPCRRSTRRHKAPCCEHGRKRKSRGCGRLVWP
jgi:hypothetical protein